MKRLILVVLLGATLVWTSDETFGGRGGGRGGGGGGGGRGGGGGEAPTFSRPSGQRPVPRPSGQRPVTEARVPPAGPGRPCPTDPGWEPGQGSNDPTRARVEVGLRAAAGAEPTQRCEQARRRRWESGHNAARKRGRQSACFSSWRRPDGHR